MSAVADHVHPAPGADEPPSPLVFTDSAAAKVKELVDEEGNPDLKLRVFVQGGGCSGFQYGFTFDEMINDDDTQMSKNGVTLLIDAMSLQYLDALKALGSGPATKFILPMELTNLLRPFIGYNHEASVDGETPS